MCYHIFLLVKYKTWEGGGLLPRQWLPCDQGCTVQSSSWAQGPILGALAGTPTLAFRLRTSATPSGQLQGLPGEKVRLGKLPGERERIQQPGRLSTRSLCPPGGKSPSFGDQSPEKDTLGQTSDALQAGSAPASQASWTQTPDAPLCSALCPPG